MSARLPLLHQTPFVLDERPLYEATSPHAGLLSISRVYRALGMPALVGANLALRKRQRGFAEAQFIESISLPLTWLLGGSEVAITSQAGGLPPVCPLYAPWKAPVLNTLP